MILHNLENVSNIEILPAPRHRELAAADTEAGMIAVCCVIPACGQSGVLLCGEFERVFDGAVMQYVHRIFSLRESVVE